MFFHLPNFSSYSIVVYETLNFSAVLCLGGICGYGAEAFYYSMRFPKQEPLAAHSGIC